MMADNHNMKEFGFSSQLSFLKPMEVERSFYNREYAHLDNAALKTTVQGDARGREPSRNGNASHAQRISESHWRKRRWLFPDLNGGGHGRLPNSQKVARLSEDFQSTSLRTGYGTASSNTVNNSSISTSREQLSTKSAIPLVADMQYIKPLSFAKFNNSKSSVQSSICEISDEEIAPLKLTGSGQLAEIIDEMMSRARIFVLRNQLVEEDNVKFVECPDGLTKVVFTNGNEDQMQISSQSILNRSKTNFQTDQQDQQQQQQKYISSKIVTGNQDSAANEHSNGFILPSKVIQTNNSISSLFSSGSLPISDCLNLDLNRGKVASLPTASTVLVESKVVGKNGFIFDKGSTIRTTVQDSTGLFHDLPECPVLIDPASAVTDNLEQPPPLGRYGTTGFTPEDKLLSSSGLKLTENKGWNGSTTFAQSQIPLFVSVPYIPTESPSCALCMAPKGYTGLKSVNLGMQITISGGCFVHSISHSLRAAVQPHVPEVKDYKDPAMSSLTLTRNTNAEATLANILKIIQKDEDSSVSNPCNEDKKNDVMKVVIGGNIMHKVSVD